MATTYTLIEHRNGTLYALLDTPRALTDPERQWVMRDIAANTGRQVLGLNASIPTQSTPGPGTNYNLLMTGFHTPENIAAMGSTLRAHGDSSPNVDHPSYVAGKFPHLIYTEKVQLLQVLEPRSEAQAKVMEAIERSYKYMPAELAKMVRAALTPQNIALMVGTLGLLAVAHAFGIGFILDVIIGAIAVVLIGTVAVQAFLKFIEFYETAVQAKTDAELERAAKLFAEVVMTIGVGATAAILTRRPLSQAGRREMDQRIASRDLSAGGSSTPQRSLDETRGKIFQIKGNMELFGPGAIQKGRAANLTDDGPFLLSKDWDDAFFVAAHSTKSSRQFYATETFGGPMEARKVAVRMWQAGYRGGDVVLVACESGLNTPLVTKLFTELSKLGLTRPVGAIYAPRRAINGQETVSVIPDRGPAYWETFSFN